jgi:hypothetical protein
VPGRLIIGIRGYAVPGTTRHRKVDIQSTGSSV